jgi:H+-translocating NAD(P) transhydrogenase subunit alpha
VETISGSDGTPSPSFPDRLKDVLMHIAILAETDPHETRVSATSETVKKFVGWGAQVTVQEGAGLNANIRDEDYAQAGALLAHDASQALEGADLVLKVRRPFSSDIGLFKSGTVLVAMMDPYGDPGALKALAEANVTTFAMEFLPRITRAQGMDVLSSQANLAGYRAVIEASHAYGKLLPMMMTAAGTIPAARVFIMGAGVAGLQAIATARRLGAVVTATDVRPAVREQVESLGAKFIAVEDEEFRQAETTGGYAREMSAEYRARQAALVAAHIAKQDIVITTALIPGKPAPVLVSLAMVESMKSGSVIVDLAAERGGNCECSRPGQTHIQNGVTILAPLNPAGQIAASASSLYARNLYAFAEVLFDRDRKILAPTRDDDILHATCLTRGGAVVHPALVGV